MQAKFRVRFRMPYFNYLELLQWIGDDTHFARWRGAKSNNKMSSPIKLMVIVRTMLRTSELDMADSVNPADIDTFIDNAAWAIHSTYHTPHSIKSFTRCSYIQMRYAIRHTICS